MSSDAESEDLIKSLGEAFSEAENEIHKTETLTQKTPVSAVNELRYAGAHMLVYMQERTPEELNQAVMHGRRAFYDAQRFLLLFLMRDAQAIRDGMGEHVSTYVDLVSKTYGKGKYGCMKKDLLAAKAFIQEIALTKTDGKRWDRRGNVYAACEPHIKAIKEYINVYESLADEFARMQNEALETARDKQRRYVIAVLGLVVAILGIVATIVCAGAL